MFAANVKSFYLGVWDKTNLKTFIFYFSSLTRYHRVRYITSRVTMCHFEMVAIKSLIIIVFNNVCAHSYVQCVLDISCTP